MNKTASEEIARMSTGSPLGDQKADGIDLFAIFGTLWRGKIWIAAAVFIVSVIGAMYALSLTPIYRSTSVVMLEPRQEQVVNLDSVMSGLGTDTQTINTEVEVLRSRQLMGRVVDELNLIEDPEFNGALREPTPREAFISKMKARIKSLLGGSSSSLEAADAAAPAKTRDAVISSLLDHVSVSNIPLTLVFRITAHSVSPEKAALLADTISAEYISNQLENKFEATEQATAWLTNRVSDLKTELEDAEAQLTEFKNGTDLINQAALQAQERQLKELRNRLEDTRSDLVVATQRLNILQAAETRTEQAEVANDQQLNQFLPRVGNEAIAQSFDARFQQILSRASLEETRLNNQISALETSEADISVQVEQQNSDFIQLQQITRETEAIRLLYEHFLTRLKETSAQQGIQQSDSTLLSAAVIPSLPTEPRKALIVIMAAFVGMIVGVTGVILREARQNTFRTARGLEQSTGITVMGQIPKLQSKSRRDLLDYFQRNPASAASEAIRNLRTSVMLSNLDAPPRVIGLTSSVPGEGKTTMAFTLAQNIAGMGKRVLLIEGDIRRRIFVQYMNNGRSKPQQRQGLISVLSGQARLSDVVVSDTIPGVDILVGEKSSVNAADLYTSDRFSKLIEEAKEHYDQIIVDTPPVLVVPDARIMLQHIDTMLFVVAWDRTQKTQVTEALHMFSSINLRVGGLILNQISARGMKRYGYGDSYGAYASYGSKYYTNG